MLYYKRLKKKCSRKLLRIRKITNHSINRQKCIKLSIVLLKHEVIIQGVS